MSIRVDGNTEFSCSNITHIYYIFYYFYLFKFRFISDIVEIKICIILLSFYYWILECSFVSDYWYFELIFKYLILSMK